MKKKFSSKEKVNFSPAFNNWYGKPAEFWPLYKNLARYFGIEDAVLLAELYEKQRFHKIKGTLDREGYFYHHRTYIESELFMSQRLQRIITKRLVESKVLDLKRGGIPARNYYRIDEKMLQYICQLSPRGLYRDWKEANKKVIEEKLGAKRYKAPKKFKGTGTIRNSRVIQLRRPGATRYEAPKKSKITKIIRNSRVIYAKNISAVQQRSSDVLSQRMENNTK